MKKPRMTDDDRAFRDRIALTVMGICMADLSRQLSTGAMPIGDAPRVISFVALTAYEAADEMLKARGGK